MTNRERDYTVYFHESVRDDRSLMRGAGYVPPSHEYSRVGVTGRIHPYYGLIYQLDGGYTYRDDANGALTLDPGDVLTLFPGVVHDIIHRDPPHSSQAFLVFDGPLFKQFEVEGLLNRKQPVRSPGLVPEVMTAFDTLIQDFSRVQPDDYPILTARIHHLIADIHRLHRSGERLRQGVGFIAKACALLQERLDTDLDLEHLANTLGVTYDQFRKSFAREIGIPPARYRLQRRVDRAKSLLMETSMEVADVAARLGYCDPYFFSRQFKQVTGHSPTTFRLSQRFQAMKE